MPKLPKHGTTARYRRELKTQTVCDRCRSANTKAKSLQRARAKQHGETPVLSLVPDTQDPRTSETTVTDDATKHTVIPPGVQNMVGGGIENAVRNYLNKTSKNDLLAFVYGEIVIAVSRVIAISDPKDIPKLTGEMVDAAKLMRADEPGGGNDDPFANLGSAT